MTHHESIEDLAESLVLKLDTSRSALIYASNTVGKTRLAQHLKDRDPVGVVLYNASIEDVFTWDNENVVLRLNLHSDLVRIIEAQGLDGAIVKTFQAFTQGKIEPTLDLTSGEVSFGIYTGDDTAADRIKISRAEESIFVWSVYHSILSEAVDTLSDKPDLRSTSEYDELTLAVIDDPVSSMDDVRIVTVALAVAELVGRASELDLRFLITTHHALFFNVLFNSLNRNRKLKNQNYRLQRGAESGWELQPQSKDSPFSYHIGIIEEIESAIARDAIQRVHFNQFRTLLEKTSNFLGYSGGWGDLLKGSDGVVLTRVLNLYSHDRFSDIDSSEVPMEYIEAFKYEFQRFLLNFKWRVAS